MLIPRDCTAAAVSSLLLAVSFLGVLLTYGPGIFLLPVPVALVRGPQRGYR
ncbi:MAG: hypothetical protein ABWX71_09670 [Aeromicrobium sp.]